MRILAVLPLVPYPPDQGDRLRAWEMLQALAWAGELHVRLVLREPASAAGAEALARLARSVQVIPLSRHDLLRGAIRGGLGGLPPTIAAYWPRRGGWPPEGEPRWDVACAFQLRAAPYVESVAARFRVLELTDALGLYRRQVPARGRAGAQRLLLRGVERLERDLPPRFDEVWVSAQADADWIARLSGRRPRVVPNGCRPVAAPAPYRAEGPFLFVGNMRYPPNEDGVVWFARQIWPAFRAARPGRRLRLVGRGTQRVDGLARIAGVEVAGFVPDLDGELAGAAALLNPIRFGGGTNRKVLDAWAAARPVLSTPQGVRGFQAVDGREARVASSPGEWLERLTWVVDHPEEAAALGHRGWEFARRDLDADAVWRRAIAESFPGATAFE